MEDESQFSKEITLKELIEKGQSIIAFLWSRKFTLISLGFGFALLFAYMAYTSKSTYSAGLSFMVNDNMSGKGGGMSGILGQFGFGGIGNDFNLDKLTQLAKSERILVKALFTKAEMGKKNDFLANHIIVDRDLQEKWAKSKDYGEQMKDFVFENDSIKGFDLIENIALKTVITQVRGASGSKIVPIISVGYDAESSILDISAETGNPELSIHLCNTIYEELSTFYKFQKTEPQINSIRVLQAKADSIQSSLSGLDRGIATFNDRSLGLLFDTEKTGKVKKERDRQILSLAYAKILENLEIAKLSFANSEPFFQIIDQPFLPISAARKNPIVYFVMGGFLGVVLGAIVLLVIRLYKSIMNS